MAGRGHKILQEQVYNKEFDQPMAQVLTPQQGLGIETGVNIVVITCLK